MAKTRYKLADEHELTGDVTRLIRELDGIEIALFNLNGEYHAVANFCPHQSGPLCEGNVVTDLRRADDGWRFEVGDEHTIVCPWHGWRFDVTTGYNPQSDRYRVPTYDVEVEDGEIFVIR